MAYLQPAAAQNMQVAMSFASIEVLHPTHRTRVVELRLHTEAIEDSGEAIDWSSCRHRNDLVCLMNDMIPIIRPKSPD